MRVYMLDDAFLFVGLNKRYVRQLTIRMPHMNRWDGSTVLRGMLGALDAIATTSTCYAIDGFVRMEILFPNSKYGLTTGA